MSNTKFFIVLIFLINNFFSYSQKIIIEKGYLENKHYYLIEQIADSITEKSTFDSTGVLDGIQEYIDHSYFEYFHSITYYDKGNKIETIFLTETGIVYEKTIFRNNKVIEFWHLESVDLNSYVICKFFSNYTLFYRLKNGVIIESVIDYQKKICHCSGT